MWAKGIGDAEVALYVKTNLTRDNIPTGYTFSLNDLRDPMGQPTLRTKTGVDEEVQDFLKEDKRVGNVVSTINSLAYDVLRLQGFKYLSISLCDHHAKWISLGVAYIAGKELDKRGYKVCIVPDFNK